MRRFGAFYPSSARVRARNHSLGRSARIPRACLSPRHMGGVQDRIAQLKEDIQNLLAKNEPLRAKIEHLKMSECDQNAMKLTMRDFKTDLRRCAQRIENRQKLLLQLEKQVLIFRQDMSAENNKPRLQDMRMPRRKKPLAQLPSLNDHKSKADAEHKRLTSKSLYYERLIILRKLQLRLCHDHRDIDQLQTQFNNLDRDHDEDETLNRLRQKCANLKQAIINEKDRIFTEKLPYATEHFAAVSIQSAWRGYIFRKKHIEKVSK